MTEEDKAINYHSCGFNCAQCVLAALTKQTGLDEKTSLSIATGFGGGLRSGEICGAIAGAAMALGMRYPHSISGDAATKAETGRTTGQFVNSFKQEFHAVTCRELLKMSAPERHCEKYIKYCIQRVLDTIKEREE